MSLTKLPLLLLGIVLSLGSSLMVLPLLVGQGSLTWIGWEWGAILGKTAKILAAALVISLIEELFFRGLLFGELKRKFRVIWAAVISSAIYAIVHFITPIKSYQYPGQSLTVGFEYLVAVIDRIFMPEVIWAFIGLFLIGLVLCYVIHKTRSLMLCIGLHSGWVMAIKYSLMLTTVAPGVVVQEGIGRRYFLVAQPLSWIGVMTVLLCILLLCYFKLICDGKTETTIKD